MVEVSVRVSIPHFVLSCCIGRKNMESHLSDVSTTR